MTLNYHLLKLTMEADTEAKAIIKEMEKAIKSLKMSDEELAKLMAEKKIDSDHALFKANAHILFTTCNNAASEFVSMGFKPDVLTVDKTGQINIAWTRKSKADTRRKERSSSNYI
ncbi:hypothetical protein ACLMJK_008128 [Lecanora helva]